MSQADLATEVRIKVKEPSMFKVVLHNDDYTPMDFVIQVLVQIFGFTPAEAMKITVAVHEQGRGICGVFTKEVADTKVLETMTAAKDRGYPLKATTEKN